MSKINNEDKYLLVVSKTSPLTKEREEELKKQFEFVPYVDEDGDSCMEAETFNAYTSLVQFMKRKYHISIESHSAWRSVETQQKLYDEFLAQKGEEWTKSHVALPGTSEHHTGLAFDLKINYDFLPVSLRSKANTLAKKLKIRNKIFKTIEKEAVQFGLIKRYSAEKKDITGYNEEDWHFRYVGVENAKKIYKSGMCLEEYVHSLEQKISRVK